MTGRETIAFVHEGSYGESPTDNDMKSPGRNIEINEMALSNALQRQRDPGEVESSNTVETRLEGAFSLSFDACSPWWLNHVFGTAPTAGGEAATPYTYEWALAAGRVQSSRWYVGVDYLTGTVERELKGVIFPSMSVQIQEGEPVRIDLTGVYGDETKNTAVTPAAQPSPASESLIFHGGSFSVDGTEQTKLQEGTLDVQTNARLQRGWSRKPVDAVMGNVETTLDVTKILTGTDLISLAYGNSNAPAATAVDGAGAGVLTFQSPGDTALRFDLTGLTPEQYNWQGVGPVEQDATEPTQYVVDQVTATASTTAANAR